MTRRPLPLVRRDPVAVAPAACIAACLLLSGCASAPPPSPPAPEHTEAARLFTDGLAAREAGDLPAAIDLLERASAAEPETLRYGAEYRQTAIAARACDRSISFFEALATEHPGSAAVRLQWGYAYVDKIPDAGAVTGVILANHALERFTEAIEREESWLALYTRGNSYVFWPPVFNRTRLGIEDLERAIGLSEGDGRAAPTYHAHAYAALGDGRWRRGEHEAAREAWRRGLERIPGTGYLEQRLALDDPGVDAFIAEAYQVGRRVDTSLREIFPPE
jgi:tetratricopeptide (TPR) repeat protein